MMVDSKKYKGIEYVEIQQLPVSQREKLMETINTDLFIKIMVDGVIVSNCLQYKDYSLWYHSEFQKREAVQPSNSPTTEAVILTKNLAFK